MAARIHTNTSTWMHMHRRARTHIHTWARAYIYNTYACIHAHRPIPTSVHTHTRMHVGVYASCFSFSANKLLPPVMFRRTEGPQSWTSRLPTIKSSPLRRQVICIITCTNSLFPLPTFHHLVNTPSGQSKGSKCSIVDFVVRVRLPTVIFSCDS